MNSDKQFSSMTKIVFLSALSFFLINKHGIVMSYISSEECIQYSFFGCKLQSAC